MQNKKTAFILLDAFRPDYVRYAPFIENMSAESLSGALIPPFGFMSTSGAIFAGLAPEESNLCNKFCLKKEAAPFNFVRFIPGVIKKNIIISSLVRLKGKGTAVSFYGTPQKIPVNLLPLFDFGQKLRPDQEGFVPSPSIFDILRKQNKTYLYLGFARPRSFAEYAGKFIKKAVLKEPYIDDEYLINSFKRKISKKDYDFMHLHLNLIDSIGHSYGPNSLEMKEAIKKTDGWVEEIYLVLRQKFSDFNFVLASDHGMTEVRGTVDIWNRILKSELKPGRDYVPFLDSTQARFWGDRKAIAYLREMLASVKGGRFLNEEDVDRYKIRFRDNRYGDLFWVCDEGTVISPNFFEDAPARGAHGYVPGCKSNYAFYLANGKGIERNKKDGDLKDLFFLLLKAIG